MPRVSELDPASILDADDELYAVVDGNSRRIPAQALSGRNLIINGSGRINQRGYVSGTATTGANQFTLDRWFVVTSGQDLTFTGDDSGRVMTAPAGGVRQVIEGANIIGGSYVLNWDGTATATVNGVARTKGEVFTMTANTNAVIAFASGTFTDVQLEKGSLATPFEWRPVGQERELCQRYYEVCLGGVLGYAATIGDFIGGTTNFKTVKRATPSVARVSDLNINNVSTPFSETISASGFRASAQSTASGTVGFTSFFAATSELTS